MPALEKMSRSAQPLYRQVECYLREQIESGALRSGDQLPSVKELCDQFGGINHLTVRQAIKNLSEENLVRSIQGRGSFVTDPPTRSRSVALLLPHLDAPIFARIAKGAQDELESQGVRSLILDSRGSQNTEADHILHFDQLPVCGAIIFPIAHSNVAEQIFQLKLRGFPFVLVDRYFEDIATPCVVADNSDGGYQSGAHIARIGRKRVGWIGESRSTTARLRLEGFRAALNDAGIPCPGARIRNLEIPSASPTRYLQATRDAVFEAVDALLGLEPAIDALVCCDDAIALHALARLQEKGRRIPDDIALMGFDDVNESAFSRPALSTVRQPMTQIGREAAKMLLQSLQKNEPISPEKRVLPVELILRETA